MQAALPLGPPVDLNTCVITAALLIGLAVFPSQQLPFQSVNNVKTTTQAKTLAVNNILINAQISRTPEVKQESIEKSASEFVNEQSINNELNTPASGQTLQQELIEHARTWIGVPYAWGGESRTGIDCSALVQKVYADYGISLPRNSREQFRQGQDVALTNVLPGDLVFFSTNGPGASHVGIYLGDGEFLSATRRQVEIQTLSTPYWQNAYWGSRRILP